MADWSSDQYLKFEKQRTQPSRDLAARVSAYNPKSILDIGCGPGNSTLVLKEAFPDAKLLGIDNSQNMIDKAKKLHPDINFCLCDASEINEKYDLIFSNACLQWIPEHEKLIHFLMSRLNAGGVLAVQVPMNGEEPFYKLIKEISESPGWGFKNVKLETNETLSPEEYFNILSSCSSSFNLWETVYYHNLKDYEAMAQWVRGTRLMPYIAVLGEERGAEFVNEIVEKSKTLYPLMDNGEIIFKFKRFFFVAEK